MDSRSSYSILRKYIRKEYFADFIVSFLFFFVIFFVNSILLLVQRILLKNIDFISMLEMVLLSMPQFLVYTIPFATLSASSMVLSDLSSTNELLAIRSCGISSSHVYKPFIIISILMSVITFLFADILHPWSSVLYRDKLAVLMAEMPTFEIESNSTNSVGSYVLSNGEASGNEIHSILLLSKDEQENNKTVLSDYGMLELVDPDNYVYSISLNRPEILLNSVSDLDSYGLSRAEKAIFYLDFSDQIPSLTSNSPVNLTSRELYNAIRGRNEVQKEDRNEYRRRSAEILLGIGNASKEYMRGFSDQDKLKSSVEGLSSSYSARGNLPLNFYAQYYKAELSKKFVLSLSCFFLTLVALPLSNIRVKHGKLTGFAVSLLVAVAFWYMLFAVQLEIFSISSSPYLLIALPDLILGIIGISSLIYFRRAR